MLDFYELDEDVKSCKKNTSSYAEELPQSIMETKRICLMQQIMSKPLGTLVSSTSIKNVFTKVEIMTLEADVNAKDQEDNL